MDTADYYNFGFNVFGPFLFGFTVWLRNRIKESKDEEIFFLSRDGYMIQKAYGLFEEEQPLNIHNSYVYFSRNSLRRALLWKTESYEDSLRYISKERFTDIATIVSYYGLDYSDVKQCIDDIGIGWSEQLFLEKLPQNEKVRKIYELNRDKIKHISHYQYEMILTYLKQIGLQGNCAIVDIGWNGSMQYYLEKIIEISGIRARIDGYYVGMSQTVPVKGRADGYLFSKDNLKNRKSITCFFGIFEKFLQSFEGSTDSYKYEEGGIIPVLKPYEYEDDRNIVDCIRSFQEGALEYITDAIHKKLLFSNPEDAYIQLIQVSQVKN